MGWRFRKSIKILPGIRLNFGKRGFTSASIGKGGWFTTNVSKRGVRNTLSAPGTGISYSTSTSGGQSPQQYGSASRAELMTSPIWFCPMCSFENVHGTQTCSYCHYFNAAYHPVQLIPYRNSSNTSTWMAAISATVALGAVLSVCAICGVIGSNRPSVANRPAAISTPRPLYSAVPSPPPSPAVALKKKDRKRAAVTEANSNIIPADPVLSDTSTRFPTPAPVQRTPSYSVPMPLIPAAPRSNGYILGPRGGCYYINSHGNKTYVDHSMCN